MPISCHFMPFRQCRSRAQDLQAFGRLRRGSQIKDLTRNHHSLHQDIEIFLEFSSIFVDFHRFFSFFYRFSYGFRRQFSSRPPFGPWHRPCRAVAAASRSATCTSLLPSAPGRPNRPPCTWRAPLFHRCSCHFHASELVSWPFSRRFHAISWRFPWFLRRFQRRSHGISMYSHGSKALRPASAIRPASRPTPMPAS